MDKSVQTAGCGWCEASCRSQDVKLVKIKVKVKVKIGGKLDQSVDAPGLGRPLVAGFVHRQPPPASTSRPRCCSEHPQYKKQPEHTGCPKKTHFQNCHQLAAAGQSLAWDWAAVLNSSGLTNNSESAFFGTPYIFTWICWYLWPTPSGLYPNRK